METSSDDTDNHSKSQPLTLASHAMLQRPFTAEDVAEVQAFATERLATIVALHPRHLDEAPGKYLDRIAALPALEDEVLVALGFIDGMSAALALEIDELFWPDSGRSSSESTATTPT